MSEIGRVHTCNFTRRAHRSRTVRVGLPVYAHRPLRRVRPVHSDHIGRCSQWTRTVLVGLALQCECLLIRYTRICCIPIAYALSTSRAMILCSIFDINYHPNIGQINRQRTHVGGLGLVVTTSTNYSRVHTDNLTRRAYRSRTVCVRLALTCSCSSGCVGYGSDVPSAHVCRLPYFYKLHQFAANRARRNHDTVG